MRARARAHRNLLVRHEFRRTRARDSTAARARIRPVALCCAAPRRRLDRRARTAGARSLRRDLLPAHVELGHGHRALRQVHDRPPIPVRRQGHAVPDAAPRSDVAALGRCPGRPAPAHRVHRAHDGRVRAQRANSAWRSHPRARADTPSTGNRASITWRAPAGVPLALAYIDYPGREVGVGGYMDLTGDPAIDMARLRAFYAGQARPSSGEPGTGAPSRRARRRRHDGRHLRARWDAGGGFASGAGATDNEQSPSDTGSRPTAAPMAKPHSSPHHPPHSHAHRSRATRRALWGAFALTAAFAGRRGGRRLARGLARADLGRRPHGHRRGVLRRRADRR